MKLIKLSIAGAMLASAVFINSCKKAEITNPAVTETTDMLLAENMTSDIFQAAITATSGNSLSGKKKTLFHRAKP